MLDREAWRGRVKMLVAANRRVDSRKRKDGNIRRIKTGISAMVVI
jgi:hypothetical protein